MIRITPPDLRLVATSVFALAVIVAPASAAAAGTANLPKVEFIEVAGRQCLQPVVNGAGAELADYRAAESRWLSRKYPGVPTPQAKTEILLSSAPRGVGQPKRSTVRRETFYFDGIVGSGAVICFDIELVTNPAEPHE